MNLDSGGGGGGSDDSTGTSVDGKSAAAYVSGTSIMWVALVELGIASFLEAMALGAVEVLFTLSDIQVALVIGWAEFLASAVRLWTVGPTAAIEAAWSGAAFETFGIFAPIVVIAELVVVFAVSTWVVRNL